MSIHRNILVQTTPVDAAQMLDRCRSALARLDTDLRLGWVNAAWQERFVAARTQLDQLDPANPSIVAAAGRARTEQRAVIGPPLCPRMGQCQAFATIWCK